MLIPLPEMTERLALNYRECNSALDFDGLYIPLEKQFFTKVPPLCVPHSGLRNGPRKSFVAFFVREVWPLYCFDSVEAIAWNGQGACFESQRR